MVLYVEPLSPTLGGFGSQGLHVRLWGLGFIGRVWGLEFRLWVLGFIGRVWGLEFRLWGLGFIGFGV